MVIMMIIGHTQGVLRGVMKTTGKEWPVPERLKAQPLEPRLAIGSSFRLSKCHGKTHGLATPLCLHSASRGVIERIRVHCKRGAHVQHYEEAHTYQRVAR